MPAAEGQVQHNFQAQKAHFFAKNRITEIKDIHQ